MILKAQQFSCVYSSIYLYVCVTQIVNENLGYTYFLWILKLKYNYIFPPSNFAHNPLPPFCSLFKFMASFLSCYCFAHVFVRIHTNTAFWPSSVTCMYDFDWYWIKNYGPHNSLWGEDYFFHSQCPLVACSSLFGVRAPWDFPLPWWYIYWWCTYSGLI